MCGGSRRGGAGRRMGDARGEAAAAARKARRWSMGAGSGERRMGGWVLKGYGFPGRLREQDGGERDESRLIC